MAQDESDFEKLLQEAREWDARDRARHKSLMSDRNGADPFPTASRAPTVTVEELGKKAATDFDRKRAPPPRAEAPRAEAPRPAASIKVALKTAVKQAQAQSAAGRAARKGNWGWIWIAILLYFIIKHFFAR